MPRRSRKTAEAQTEDHPVTDAQHIDPDSANGTAAADGPTGANGQAPDGTMPANSDEPSDLTLVMAERDEYLGQLQRSLADFANYRRRVEQERTQIRQAANRDLLLHLLPVVDDFQRALAAVPAEQRETGWVAGTAMIEKKLQSLLERAGVSPLEALGQPFDPALHEAVASDPGSSGELVVEVFRTGYKLGDQVLRAAMVKTGDAPVA